MATIGSLVYAIEAQTTSFNDGVKNVEKSLASLNNSMVASIAQGVAWGNMIDKVAQKVLSIATDTIRYADQLVNLSEKTKLSTDAIQELTLAFLPHGISIEAVATANEKLAKNLIGGDKSSVAALEKLGLSVNNLKSLSPDALFLTVADAVGQIKNPTEQAYAAMTIFGRGGQELLAGLDGHLKETTQHFKDMGLIIDEKTVKAADDFGDSLGLMGKQLLAIVATLVGPLLPGLSALGSVLLMIGDIVGSVVVFAIKALQTVIGVLLEGFARWLAAFANLATKIPVVGKHLTALGDASRWLTAYADGTSDAVGKLWKDTDQLGTSAEKAHAPLIGLGADSKDAADAAKKAAEEAKKQAEEYEKLMKKLHEVEFGFTGLNSSLADFNHIGHEVSVHIPTITEQIESLGRAGQHAEAALLKMGGTLAGGLRSLPSVQFAGIGILPDVSPGGGFNLDGVKEKTDNWHTSLSETTRALSQLATVAGGTFGGIVKSLSEITAATNVISAGVTATTKEGGSFLDKLAGGLSIAGGVGSLIGGAVNFIKGIGGPDKNELASRSSRDSFMGQFQGPNDATGIQTLASQITKIGISADTARAQIAAMLDAKNPQAFAAALLPIQQALKLGADAQTALNDALSRYQFTTEQLGPALERQNLDAQAQQLFKDWTVLNAAQVDTVAISSQMGANVSQFLADSIKSGTEVPIAMKTMLEQMAKMGNLTDAAGNQITDLATSGVTFSETMTQGFQDVVKSIKDLTNALRSSLGLAIDDTTDKLNGIPRSVDVAVTYSEAGMGDGSAYASRGGLITSGGVQYFGAGGNVLPFRSRGTDTVPAMLTPGEMVLTRAQQRAVFGSGGGGVTEIHTHLHIDGREVSKTVSRHQNNDLRTRRKLAAA